MAENIFGSLIRVVYEVLGAQKAKKEIVDTEVAINQTFDTMERKAKVPARLAAQMDMLSNSMKKVGFSSQQIEQVTQNFKNISPLAQLSAASVNRLQTSLVQAGATQPQISKLMGSLEVDSRLPVAVSSMSKLMGILQRAAIVAPIWMLVRNAMMSVFSLIQNQLKFIVDMEDAMARIQIVGKGTTEEFNNLKFSLIGLALEYGTSASEALNAAKIFAQQGKTVAETFVLTRVAMIGAQVLGQDVKTTTEDLTAAMNSFNIPASNATGIIDKLINVEKQFAVTSVDLSSGIKVVGATANQMGVSLSALAGDITAIIEVTRKTGSEAARGLQFMYSRLLTSAKPVIEQLTGIKFYLDANNKATSSLTGTLRSATDILDELALSWGNLTNQERLQVAESLGSKRQMTIVNALMDNYNHSIDARIVALTSAGSAEKAFNIIQETTSFKLKQLSSSWNALTAAMADTSAFKGVIDFLDKIIVGYATLIDAGKGYRILLSQQTAQQLSDVETRQSQIDSMEELINVRNKLMLGPQSKETTSRIELINKTLETTVKTFPELKVNLTTGTSSELKESISNIQDKLLREKVTLQFGVDFNAKIMGLQDRKKTLTKLLGGLPEQVFEVDKGLAKNREELLGIDKQIASVEIEQKEEVEKQYAFAKTLQILKTRYNDDAEDTTKEITKLTDKEIEQLNLEREMMNFTMLTNASLEEQIQKRIELTNLAEKSLSEHEMALELSKLETQLLDAKLKKRDEEVARLGSLALQYEKLDRNAADYYEKRRELELAAELSMKSPESLAASFAAGKPGTLEYDTIIKFWDSFSNEAQAAMEQTSWLFRSKIPGMPEIPLIKTGKSVPTAKNTADKAVELLNVIIEQKGFATAEDITNLLNNPEPTAIINTTNKAAEILNIIIEQRGFTTADDIANLVGPALLNNPDFVSAFTSKSRKII